MLFLSFLVMVKVRRSISALIQLLRNFVSCHVVFLEHIPFFSIPFATMTLLYLTLFALIISLRILIVCHLKFLILQIPLLMFFILFLYIILDVFVLLVQQV